MSRSTREICSEEEIVSTARPIDLPSGIYFLVQGDSVVYVGQSKNVYARIATHLNEGQKIFDKAAFIDELPEKLNEVESTYIAALKPQYNKISGPISNEKMTLDELQELVDRI